MSHSYPQVREGGPVRVGKVGVAVGLGIIFGAAVAAAQPQSMEAAGQTLSLKSVATRSRLFGLVDLYQVALYAPQMVSSPAELVRNDVPKALRVEVKYDGSLPDLIPLGWREELEPELSNTQLADLKSAYASLMPEDEIRVVYVLGEGTTVSVSGKTVVTDAGHELMAAFLDIWMGQTPVSEDVKRELVMF